MNFTRFQFQAHRPSGSWDFEFLEFFFWAHRAAPNKNFEITPTPHQLTIRHLTLGKISRPQHKRIKEISAKNNNNKKTYNYNILKGEIPFQNNNQNISSIFVFQYFSLLIWILLKDMLAFMHKKIWLWNLTFYLRNAQLNAKLRNIEAFISVFCR